MKEKSLFDKELLYNQLKGKRVCLNGTFNYDVKVLNGLLKRCGVTMIDRVSASSCSQEGATMLPTKENTHLYVVGKNPNIESLKRYELNKHDGFLVPITTEHGLMELIEGTSDIVLPEVIQKRLDLSIDYYNWKAPIINGKEFVSRLSSPLQLDTEMFTNGIYGKEIFVPECKNVDMLAFRQLIGNFGGFANNIYDDDTNIILLGDETLQRLRDGLKDDIIKYVENTYNRSDSKLFNIQFLSHADFLNWVKARLKRFPDTSSQMLLNKVKNKMCNNL